MKQLPMPLPLPESIPIRRADPPAEMDLVAVPTGVNTELPPMHTRAGPSSTGASSTSAPRSSSIHRVIFWSTPVSGATSPSSWPRCPACSGR